MKIGLIGAGRLGICLALLIERAGYDVLVSDVREDYVSNLNKRKLILTNRVLDGISNKLKDLKQLRTINVSSMSVTL